MKKYFFLLLESEIIKNWDVSLRAPNQRVFAMRGERWLREDDDNAIKGGC